MNARTIHNEDIHQLIKLSQQSKFALLTRTFEKLYAARESFLQPPSINGTRIALEIEHRGLGEDRAENKTQVFRKRRFLKDKCERGRRQQKEYYEELLRDTARSDSSGLGKRKVNEIGVPEDSIEPSDLIHCLAPHQLGNYPSVPGMAEKRLRAIADPSLFEGKRVLELGCGDGALVHEIVREYKNCYLKGVDADSKLIELAACRARTCGGERPGDRSMPDLDKIPICFRNRSKREFLSHFRSAAESLPTSHESSSPERPKPVFETENIIKDITKYKHCQFDTVVCLSVAKWIHLNWGDRGLYRLLLKFYNSLKIGGRLVFDIHNWKSYKRMKRTERKQTRAEKRIGPKAATGSEKAGGRQKREIIKTFAYQYSAIAIKPKGILDRLYKLGFELEREIPLGFETELKRPIYILRKMA